MDDKTYLAFIKMLIAKIEILQTDNEQLKEDFAKVAERNSRGLYHLQKLQVVPDSVSEDEKSRIIASAIMALEYDEYRGVDDEG